MACMLSRSRIFEEKQTAAPDVSRDQDEWIYIFEGEAELEIGMIQLTFTPYLLAR
jgi:hypothetical protein